MDNLLSGLDNLGINTGNIGKLYDDEDKNKEEILKSGEVKKQTINEEDFIFEKTMICPVCGKEFKTKVVRTGKVKLTGSDTDLKPHYSGMEPLKYDVIVCLHCGYAATSKAFGHITPKQAQMVRESISKGFKGMTNPTGAYSFEEAIYRHKLALANVITTHGKTSERAYLCLKMAWLYRSMCDGISDKSSAEYKKYKELENECMKSAYEGFSAAYMKEEPPICGMDINTLTYLLADLARRTGDISNCKKYIMDILNSRSCSARIKERARELKELLDR